MLYLALACAPGGDTADTEPADTDTDTDADTDTDTDTDTDSDTDTDTDTDTDADCATNPTARWFHDGAWEDITATLPTALPAVPLAIDEGEVEFCGGTWFVRIATTNDVVLTGLEGATLNGGAQGTVVTVGAGSATLTGLTLTGGRGLTVTELGYVSGGGLLCDESGAMIRLTDVTITANTSDSVGAGLAVGGCTLDMVGGSIMDNTAVFGAGIWVGGVSATEVNLDGVTVQSNASEYTGGGAYVEGSVAVASLNLTDTLVLDNVAGTSASSSGGGVAQSEDANVTCTGTGAGTAAFERNSAISGGAAFLVTNYGGVGTFTATNCDLGVDGAADDNTTGDIRVYNGSELGTFEYGDAASFVCTTAGCP